MHFKHILPMKVTAFGYLKEPQIFVNCPLWILCTFLKIVLFIYYKTVIWCGLNNLFKNQNIWLVVTFTLGQDDQEGRNQIFIRVRNLQTDTLHIDRRKADTQTIKRSVKQKNSWSPVLCIIFLTTLFPLALHKQLLCVNYYIPTLSLTQQW